jgi:hypothetical protein
MKIIRTPTHAKGGITDKEKEQMSKVSDAYIANAYKTGFCDRKKLTESIEKLYKVSGLEKPRVVIVDNPLIMALAYGISAAFWHIKKYSKATFNATFDATSNATEAATDAATDAATYLATRAATDAATYFATFNATYAATRDATDAATFDATRSATEAATFHATCAATEAATDAATFNATYFATDTATLDATYLATRDATEAATDAATRTAIDAATDTATLDATYLATDAATYLATRAATRTAIDAATDAATYFATRSATEAATFHATFNATRDAPRAATEAATRTAIDVATYFATFDATFDAAYDATRDATRDATEAATFDETFDVTYFATRAATEAATFNATYAATLDATDAATFNATFNATYAATLDATDAATFDATEAATDEINENWYESLIKKFVGVEHKVLALECAKRWPRVSQGGNMWSGGIAFFAAMRDVLKLTEVDCWDNYQHWEDAGKNGGFRVMHEKFCIVVDFPECIKIDDQNRPHSLDSPSHKWRGGFEVYYIHGVKVDKRIVMSPETITVREIEAQENTEVRRVMMERYGLGKYLLDSGAKEVARDVDNLGFPRVLYRKKINGDEDLVMVHVKNSTLEPDGTRKDYFLRVPPNVETPAEAIAWTFEEDDNYNPIIET